MSCRPVQEAISARIDGEEPGLPLAQVEAHVAGCADCRAFAAAATSLHRRVRVRPAEAVPDLSASILAASAPARPRAVPAVREWPRYVLLVVALTQLLIALPALVLGDETGTTVHLARELGSWDAALAVAWLVVTWAPRRAAGLLPFAVVLAAVMLGTALLDLVDGRADIGSESHHVLDLAGLAMVWLLARSTPSTRPLLPWAARHQPRAA
jgi:predicted anti-sigma-YlaC factor YlaD